MEARSASSQRLLALLRSVNDDLDLDRTLTAVCRGLVDGLGFGVAAVNLVLPDGGLEVVVCEGNAQARAALLGQQASRESWDALMAGCVPVGDLLVDFTHQDLDARVPSWSSPASAPVAGDAGAWAWDPRDTLLAPLRTRRSGLLGVISVDLPGDGLRPAPDQLELLEMYAAHASVAIEHAQLHGALQAQDDARAQALGRLAAVVDSVPLAIVETDLQGRVRLWNDAAETIFGWRRDEVVGRPDPVAPAGQDAARPEDGSGSRRAQTRRARRDGTGVDVERTSCTLVDEAGVAYGHLGVYVDVSHRVRMEQELRTAAYTDPLTGLANRTAFTARIRTAGAHASVLLLDLDGFKAVNDTLGHAAGDVVLVEVARRLRAVCRAEDVVGRLGGDEFVVLPATPATATDSGPLAEHLARRLVEVLAEPFELAGRQVSLGASVGVAVAGGRTGSSQDGLDAGQELLRDADVAMYVAKAAGKGRVQVFAPEMRDSVVERTGLGQDLRAALERDELFLRWQPVVQVRTGQVVGLEALVRWQHPQRGELAPGTFIGLAEDSGLIVALGALVLQQACAQLRDWHDLLAQRCLPPDRRLSVSVNVSPVQVAAPGLVETVRRCLRESGVHPGRLILELTEDVLLHDDGQVVAVLQELRDLGVRLAVDDFGVGYASLSYLKRLPLDIVKLDRSLLWEADSDPASLAVLQAVVTLTGRLGLPTVAEGVETPDQWALLQQLGCPMAQGYLFAEPLLAAQVPDVLDAGGEAAEVLDAGVLGAGLAGFPESGTPATGVPARETSEREVQALGLSGPRDAELAVGGRPGRRRDPAA